jgi:hypothetical protein
LWTCAGARRARFTPASPIPIHCAIASPDRTIIPVCSDSGVTLEFSPRRPADDRRKISERRGHASSYPSVNAALLSRGRDRGDRK